MVNSKKTLPKKTHTNIDALPAVYVQVKADYTPMKKQTRSQANIDRENRMHIANLQVHNGQDTRFFDAEWNEYPANYDFPGDLPDGLSQWKWNKKLQKYVKKKDYT